MYILQGLSYTREIKNCVYGKQQMANMRFMFMFFWNKEYKDENSAN